MAGECVFDRKAELERQAGDPGLPLNARIDAAEELLAALWAQTWGETGDEKTA